MVPQQNYSMNTVTVVCDVSFVSKPDASANCTNVHVKANPNCMMNHSVNATSATNVCTSSYDLKANVQISRKTKCVNMQFKVDSGVDTNLLPLDLYHKLHPKARTKWLQKDPSVHLFAYNGFKIQYFGICPLQVHFKNNCFVVNFYVIGKGKLILGLEGSRNLCLISMHCPVEKSTNFDKVQPANHAKAQTTHPLLVGVTVIFLNKTGTDLTWLWSLPQTQRQILRQVSLLITLWIPLSRFNMISKYKICKEQVTEHLYSVFDTYTMGNLPARGNLELKENAIPYQAPVHTVPQALHKPLKSELDKLVDQAVICKLGQDEWSDLVSMPICVKKPNGSLWLSWS